MKIELASGEKVQVTTPPDRSNADAALLAQLDHWTHRYFRHAAQPVKGDDDAVLHL